MPPGGQENMPAVAPPPPPLVKPAAAAAPFRFRAPRALIDWRTLRALDVGAVVRDTDLDALEGVLEAVAGGDLEAEDPRALPWADLAKLFRVAQLTVDYLLHVQDRLATDAGAAQARADGRAGHGRRQTAWRAEQRKSAPHMPARLRLLNCAALPLPSLGRRTSWAACSSANRRWRSRSRSCGRSWPAAARRRATSSARCARSRCA